MRVSVTKSWGNFYNTGLVSVIRLFKVVFISSVFFIGWLVLQCGNGWVMRCF